MAKPIHLGKDKHGVDMWRLYAAGGPDGKGGYKRVSKRFHGSPKEAQDEQRRLEFDAQQHGIGSSMTFREWTERHYLPHIEKTLAPLTVMSYRRQLTMRVLPALGKYRLDQMQPRHIAGFLKGLEIDTSRHKKLDAEGKPKPPERLSGHTRLKYYRLVSNILQEAVYLGAMSTNPAKAVKAPRAEQYRARYYSQQDAKALWEALQGEPLLWRCIISTALLLALRRSEMMGLRWGDINWEKQLVTIQRAAYRIAGIEQRVKTPKTARSLRALPLPPMLVDLLQAWRKEQGGGDEDYIAAERRKDEETGEEQLCWLHVDAPPRWFITFVKRRGLPPLTFHGMRHTAATVLLASGLPVSVVQEYLGHTQATTTMNIYGHAEQGDRNRISGLIETAFSPEIAPDGANDGENEHES